MGAADEIRELRRQRNRAAVGAALFVVAAIAFTLPVHLRRYRELAMLEADQVRLEREIVSAQSRIVFLQNEIRQVQADLTAAIHARP
jgi:hypothetical protein